LNRHENKQKWRRLLSRKCRHFANCTQRYESLAISVGETGQTTSPLRPTGKALLGGVLIDVTAHRAFVKTDSLVEVIDVQGPRFIVKRVWS
jgi:membrane-bound ClpP family serine protease